MSYLALDNRRIFYTEEGDGSPTLLLVHGMSCDSHDWIWQMAHFARTYRTVAVDLRGHGRSDPAPSGYGLGEYASDLASMIEHLTDEPVIVMGHSLGGMIVSVLAATALGGTRRHGRASQHRPRLPAQRY